MTFKNMKSKCRIRKTCQSQGLAEISICAYQIHALAVVVLLRINHFLSVPKCWDDMFSNVCLRNLCFFVEDRRPRSTRHVFYSCQPGRNVFEDVSLYSSCIPWAFPKPCDTTPLTTKLALQTLPYCHTVNPDSIASMIPNTTSEWKQSAPLATVSPEDHTAWIIIATVLGLITSTFFTLIRIVTLRSRGTLKCWSNCSLAISMVCFCLSSFDVCLALTLADA
jgi:hypothetical protein